jgi:DNA uptake protein ComE-like DNA-binding protein
VVLVVVLVVVAVLALAAYAFHDVMMAENEVTQMVGRQVQAYSLAASGVADLRVFLMQDAATQSEAGGRYDNAARFQAVTVVQEEGETDTGRFTVVAPALDTEGNASGVRYGLEDESARLNLNALTWIETQGQALGQETAGRDLLMALPGMTEETADAILDWLDEDEEPREYGAESDYYSSLSPGYAAKNGQLETVEELLLVRGVTPQLLFGADVNRNGIIDAGEMEQSGAALTDTESITTGWAGQLTLYSKENNVTAEGLPRVNLNDQDDMNTLYETLAAVLPEDQARFIVAYRQQTELYTGTEPGEPDPGDDLDLAQPGKTELNQVLDLIDAKVKVTFKGAKEPVVLASPFTVGAMNTYMSQLMDQVTARPVLPGRININHASRDILEGIPGMPEGIVEQIIGQRNPDPGADGSDMNHETWLLTQGLVTLDQMRTLTPFVCAGGSVYRAQVIGYYDDGRAASRLEVVLDATQQPASVLLWRDISHLGRGYSLEILGAAGTAEGM